MRYLDTTEFLKELMAAVEEQAGQQSRLREEIEQAASRNDGATLYEAVPNYMATYYTEGAYRWVLSLVDKYSFELNEHYGRLVTHMLGQPCPAPIPWVELTLSAKLRRIASLGFSAYAVVSTVLLGIKEFDDWLSSYWRHGEAECSGMNELFERTMIDISNEFHQRFGRPGIAQEVPRWCK